MGLAAVLLLSLCLGGAAGAVLLFRAGRGRWSAPHARPMAVLFFFLSAACAALALWTAPFAWEAIHFRF